MDILTALERIPCECERADFLREAIPTHDGLCSALTSIGFDGAGGIPTDWRSYFHDDELREFVLSYATGAA